MAISLPQVESLRSRDPLLYEAFRALVNEIDRLKTALDIRDDELDVRIDNVEASDVTGSGSAGYLPKFTSASTVGNSVIVEAAGAIGIGITPTDATLELSGTTPLRIPNNSYVQFRNAGGGVKNVFKFGSDDHLYINAGTTGDTLIYGAGETARFKANGRVGVGTNAPDEIFQVGVASETSTNRKAMKFSVGGFGAPGNFSSASNGDKIIFYNGADFDGRFGISGIGDVWLKSLSTQNANQAYGSLNFYTGQGASPTPTNRLSISGTGNVGIGGSISSPITLAGASMIVNGSNVGIAATPVSRLDVRTTSDTTGAPLTFGDAHVTIGNGSTGALFFSYDQTNNRGFIGCLSPGVAWRNTVMCPDGGNLGIYVTNPTYRIQVNGQPAANGYTAWTNYSDERLKTNIRPIGTGALDKVMRLEPVVFKYTAKTGGDAKDLERDIHGFVAQKLRTVFPEMVGETTIGEEKFYDSNLSALPVYLVRALQELVAKLRAAGIAV